MTSHQDLNYMANEVIATCTSIFPFSFFPSTIEVTRTRITIFNRYFFFSERVFPILVGDLTNVKIEKNPFFATIRFELTLLEKNPEPVRFLEPRSAQHVVETILGLLEIENNRDVQVSQVERTKIQGIGQSRPLA